jgi:RNA polymerase sigma-70 factor (ECF subfamily)
MDSPGGWAFGVAVNVLRRRLRRAAIERRLLLRQAAPVTVAPGDLGVELWAAVRGLPARMREAIALRYVRDLTEDEVAATMGVAPGTASDTLHVARRRLAIALGEGVEERTDG